MNSSLIKQAVKFLYHRRRFPDKTIEKQFILELGYLNYHRLKIIGYFAIIFSTFQLAYDISLSHSANILQVSRYIYPDTFLFIVSIILVSVTHIKKLKQSSDVKPWHVIFVHIYILVLLLWASSISFLEYETIGSATTFLTAVFMVATIFLVKNSMILIYYLLGLALFYYGLFQPDITNSDVFYLYVPAFALIIIAWIVSRILYSTRLNSFLITRELEHSRNSLDSQVKERTAELSETNIKLIKEINERENYEKKLELETIRAQQSDTLKSKFLANMSHEIRTPLNGIIGFGDLLKRPELSPEKRNRYIEIISANSLQLLKIIDDIVDISMIESDQIKINLSRFNLSRVLPDAVDFFNNIPTSKKGNLKLINAGFENSHNEMVNSDPVRIRQILYNLISNAIKFTQTGHIRIGGKVEDGYAMIFVEDTGIGIDPEQCNTIFERFRQGEEAINRTYGGTGLGLSISKGLIELLGGMIWIDLSYTRGSRFCFTLPTEEAIKNSHPSVLKECIDVIEQKCLIVGEFENTYRGFLTSLLKIYTTSIPIFNLSKPQSEILEIKPAIILIDTQRTDGKIFSQIENVLNTFKSAREIIVVSATSDSDTDKKLIESGCTMILHTPVNLQLLLVRIYQYLIHSGSIISKK
jgi:signal transduction histidine kinase